MSWNFFDMVREIGLAILDITLAPAESGYYLLFAEQGEFIYVGKADDLRQRLADHYGDNEDNERIRGIARYAIWQQTPSIADAEQAEGNLYDAWVRMTGVPPFANKIKPPCSRLTDDEILRAKLKQLLQEHSSLARRLQ